MLLSDIITDGIGLLSRQLRFYCWHYKRDLDSKQQQELLDLLDEHYFEKLANKIKLLIQSNIDDCRQQVGKLLFEQCLVGHRRNQLFQLIESDLVDINVRLDNYGRTLLHRTAYNLDVELVKLLVEHGVNIRLRDYAGNTALHIAIQSYRNGALIYNNESEVVQNLTAIIKLLLEADRGLQLESALKKRVKLDIQDTFDPINSQSLIARKEPSPKSKICKTDHKLQQNDLVTDQHLNSPPRGGTLCRIMGANCTCRNPSRAHNQNQLSESNVETIQKESHQPNASPKRMRPAILQSVYLSNTSSPLLMDEDPSAPLIDTKNAFGRTALHYCVLVVGEQHLDHFVNLLIAHGADVNVVDTRLKTPLYCLVKRPGVAAVRQKCLAITSLIENGCDDLGLALERPRSYFNKNMLRKLESNIIENLSRTRDDQTEPIFVQNRFKRVPSLKHLARLALIRINAAQNGKPSRQTSLRLPLETPHSLNDYVNRKILDQSELF